MGARSRGLERGEHGLGQLRTDRVLTSGAEDVVDDGQRARVAALDGAGLAALRALQPLPGPARPQRPARPGRGPS